ncbi:hypothetical protein E2C01_011317 [Portunus trituberculatus]|uniref:Uncharacterized protein n=1 Tax=Portunus trituberculatus TaxID=210409 RepID=A0A5B7DB29_PORTR|nr:hypothetical protein [Portunus trituberculatus]
MARCDAGKISNDLSRVDADPDQSLHPGKPHNIQIDRFQEESLEFERRKRFDDQRLPSFRINSLVARPVAALTEFLGSHAHDVCHVTSREERNALCL